MSEESWIESLPETLREAPFISKAESPEKALEELQNAAGWMGNSIRLPGEDATDDARKEFYGKLAEKAPGVMVRPDPENMTDFYRSMGMPEDVNGYKWETPEGKSDPDDLGIIAEVAHKAGLSQDQFKTMVDNIMESKWTQEDQYEAEHKEAMAGLATEWGQAYDGNMAGVRNFLKLTDAPEGIVDLITQGAMSPEEIKWLHKVATQTKSSVELADQQQQRQAALTPAEAQMRIAELLDNPAYWDAANPLHKSLQQKMLEYQQAAAPNARMDIDQLRAG